MTGVLGILDIVHGTSKKQFDAQLAYCGYEPEPLLISTWAELAQIQDQPDYQSFIDLIGDAAEGIYRKPKTMYFPRGILVLLMTKQPGTGFPTWLRNRIRSLTGALGWDASESFWDNSLLPTADTATVLHRVLSSNFPIKNRVFTSILSGANQDNNATVSNLCKAILNLLMCSEMSHVSLIEISDQRDI